MQQELESQLHEQYAINNNSNLSSVVTLFVALIAVFGGYGYVFIHSSLWFDFEHFYDNSTGLYSLDALLFVAMAVFVVIFYMEYICLYQGNHQRFEQFVTYAIRCKYYHEKPEKKEPRLYPSSYTPFDKDDKTMTQGLFVEFLELFKWSKYTLIISIIAKFIYVAINCICFYQCSFCCVGLLEILLLLFIIYYCWKSLNKKKSKMKKIYAELEEEYKYLK